MAMTDKLIEPIIFISEFHPPAYSDERLRDLFPEFLFCVLIPAGVLLLVLLVLSCIMCCGRNRRAKYIRKDENDPEIQRYNSIRRASMTLRHLSDNREIPLVADPSKSAPGTLQRHSDRAGSAPPSYAMEPGYSAASSQAATMPRSHRYQPDQTKGIIPGPTSTTGRQPKSRPRLHIDLKAESSPQSSSSETKTKSPTESKARTQAHPKSRSPGESKSRPTTERKSRSPAEPKQHIETEPKDRVASAEAKVRGHREAKGRVAAEGRGRAPLAGMPSTSKV